MKVHPVRIYIYIYATSCACSFINFRVNTSKSIFAQNAKLQIVGYLSNNHYLQIYAMH